MPILETGKSNSTAARSGVLAARAGLPRRSGVIAAKAGPAGHAGFTLVEIAIVVFIISLFTAFALPRLPDIGTYKLEKNCRRVAHTITYLYSQASSHRMLLRLNFDLKTGKYYASTMDKEGNFVATDFPLFKKGRLSDGVKVFRFTTLYNGTFGGASAYMHLMPEGFAEQSVIVLSDRSGRKLSLVVDPLSGRVRIRKGEITLRYAGKPA